MAPRWEDGQVASGVLAVEAADLDRWCREHLNSAPITELFRSGHLSIVVGVRLADEREVVVKARPDLPRLAACFDVQRRLFRAGFPCPQLLAGPAALVNGLATAEAYVPGGNPVPSIGDVAQLSAQAFASLVRLGPRTAEIASPAPPPSWAAWDHGEPGLWPRPDGSDVNLNAVEGPAWLDWAADRARKRLRASVGEVVVGHCDWLGDNVRWQGDQLLVVHDWDSVIAEREAVLAGFAAALYATTRGQLPTVQETERFLDAYEIARGRAFSGDELEQAWAAGVWTRACDAKEEQAAGQAITSLSESEARARLGRAGLS
jgi:hypothetical protein